jgi:hypothetical protein
MDQERGRRRKRTAQESFAQALSRDCFENDKMTHSTDNAMYGGIKDTDLEGMRSMIPFHRATYILMLTTGEETILTGSICQDQDLPLDDKLLTWFGVPDDPAKQVCSVLKSQYAHGNTYVRMGIGALVHGMLSILQERHNLKQESQKATHELRHAEELCRELQESNEALRLAQDATASLEVSVSCFLSTIFPLT